MSTLRTYLQDEVRGRPRVGCGERLRAAVGTRPERGDRHPALWTLLVALALALACTGAGALPAAAWANTSETMLGINLEVPSTTQQGAGSSTTGGASGTSGLVGINLTVPNADPPAPGAGEGAGSGESSTSGMLGINLVVPSTTQVGGSGSLGTSGTSGTLGINLVIPSITEEKPAPGDDYDSTNSTEGILGINLVVPSTVEQGGGLGTSGTAGILGVNLKVPKGMGVSFDPNHGQGQVLYVPVTPGEPVERPSYEPTWPNRVFVGWFAEQKDYVTDDDVPWDFSTPIEGSRTLYAGWKLVDPLEDGTVRLHLVVDEGYAPEIADAEAGSHGIVPPGYVLDPDDTEYGPTYVGSYWLGGGEEIDSTLALPDPQMEGGLFEMWRTEYSHALDENGSPIEGKVGSYGGDSLTQVGRFDVGAPSATHPEDGAHAHELWAQWDFVETHTVTFVSNGGSEVAPLKVRDGGYATAPADPVREGWDFGGWYEDEELTRSFSFATTRVMRDLTLYAKWNEIPQFPVRFDAGGGVPAPLDQLVARGGLVERPNDPVKSGWTFEGWWTGSGGTGSAWDFERDVVTGAMTLYAKWAEAPEGTWTVTFDAAGGAWEGDAGAPDGAGTRTVSVASGSTVARPDDPKRAGWQLPGTGAWALEDGTPWDFGRDVVTGDLTLYAKWALRLDVTVPVSVAFAVDAATGEAAGPDADAYALRSRTVRAVEVESLALESRQGELEAFFALAAGEEGGAQPTWEAALAGTSLSLAPAGADAVALPFAGEEANGLWSTLRELGADERASWTMAAFDYGATGATPDDAWQGGDPSVRLPLALALEISDGLEAKTDLDGPRPIAHLKVTVSAEA